MKLHFPLLIPVILCACTGCSLVLPVKCALFFPKKMPGDVQLGSDKCIALGLGSADYAVYRFPDDEKTQRIFNEWWSHTKRLGTNAIAPYASPTYRLYFSKQLTLYFDEDNSWGLMLEYGGKEWDGARDFYKKAGPYDRALMEHVREIVRTSKKLPDAEAEALGLRCTDPQYFFYKPWQSPDGQPDPAE